MTRPFFTTGRLIALSVVCVFSPVFAEDPVSTNEAAEVDPEYEKFRQHMDEYLKSPEEPSPEDPDYKTLSDYLDDHFKVKLGAGIRTSIRATEDSAPDGDTFSKDFNLDNARLYVSGKALDYIGFEFNSEIVSDEGGAEDFEVLDAVIKFEPHEFFNIWAGRFLPPSDRSNLSGPFYLNAYDFPFVQAFPAKFAGRDNGVATWGQLDGGKFKWQAGVFEGSNGAVNKQDNPLFSGRLVLNLLDPEPGYYNASTYYGAKDILAIGVTGMFQENSVGTLDAGGDVRESNNFTGFNIDVLFEKKLGSDTLDIPFLTDGVVTLEGAYYLYDDDDLDEDAQNLLLGETVSGDRNRQGESFLVLGSFLFPQEIGAGVVRGRLQPYFRYQKYDRSSNTGLEAVIEPGINYILDGHNARISAFYQNLDVQNGSSSDSFVLAGQFQF